MTNKEVRHWYLSQVSQIPTLNEDWVSKGLSAVERARRAWRIRHDARLEARKMMNNPIEVRLLQERDRKLYGSPDGPSFESLIEKATKLGFEGDKMYEAIITDSFTTNAEVDKKFGS